MPKGGKRSRSGPPKKPLELKLLEGGYRKDRDGATPPVQGGFPVAPEWLSEAEAKLWATFPRPAWIGETDQHAVNAAVSLLALILQNQAAMRATAEAGSPLTFKVSHDGDGTPMLEPKANPLYGQQLQLWGRLMSVLGTLGLTPADRGKVSVPQAEDTATDTWAQLLG